MAAEQEHEHEGVQDLVGAEGEEDAEFVNQEDIEIIYTDDEDMPMDEDEGEGEDAEEEEEEELPEPTENTSVARFPSHGKSVFAVSIHPTQPLAASGGEDDLGYVWDLRTGEVITKLSGHEDSVVAVEWSADGEMVATGGMDGKVRIWRRVGKEKWTMWEFLNELQGPDEVMWLKWHPRGPVLLAGSNDSTVWLWQLPSGNTMQVFAGHEGPVHTGNFTPDGKRIVTADQAGTLIAWDPRGATPLFKLTPSAHFPYESGITSLSVNPACTLAVVGGAEGAVRVVNLNKGEVLGGVEGHREGESVEAIEFVELVGAGVGAGGVVVTGATDGKACIWDVGTMRLRVTLEHDDAVTSLHSHASAPHLITSASADRTLKTWDARTGQLIKEHKGHRGMINAADVSRDGKYAVSAGDEGVCLVWDLQ
ncbi:WD40 repeat-like protein [Calocera cornea HHB12733]|uniref:WD40 repeat-like protein n=1 Tax=Calocera cornea HHB12733 TaxID=1353952 RepID=A0A165G6T4_9BASI|nr:WD40 repeat-like protein [Calocera cornea HHB12733]